MSNEKYAVISVAAGAVDPTNVKSVGFANTSINLAGTAAINVTVESPYGELFLTIDLVEGSCTLLKRPHPSGIGADAFTLIANDRLGHGD